jgi:hypothetical protein
MGLFRRTLERAPATVTEPDFRDREGTKDWAGLWKLDRGQMIWWRPEHYYFKSPRDGVVGQNTQQHMGPMLRPGPLHFVGQHIDISPLAALRSHPDEPGALPEHLEGLWVDTNPAWPEMSIQAKLGRRSVVIAQDMPRDEVETYDLVPSMDEGLRYPPIEAITPENSIPFDATPLSLSAVVIYLRKNRN